MKKIKISAGLIQELLTETEKKYPKYTTQIINLANQNAQATRPKFVGQMSDLIQEFDGYTMLEWKEWYLQKHPKSIDEATKKVYEMLVLLKDAIHKIDENLVRQWIEELVIEKTFVGLKFQEAILKKIANDYKKSYRLAKSEEEQQGIDGFIDEKPISIKPNSYKNTILNEQIHVFIIFYEKKKDGLIVEFDETYFELI